eukprot:TRINITY_DN67767_c0_g1_i1.p1 TRINITY_DN67767_c0_g1~~TRINITY_DN67767_c0_g1_i1.p1  ORF type:complete len:403 (-),score=49.17 TRINITY_DN67767_c0_g1_i1:61-1269(-)
MRSALCLAACVPVLQCSAEWLEQAVASDDECEGEQCSTEWLQVAARALPGCSEHTPCPATWRTSGGGYWCMSNNGCRPAAAGPFPSCSSQCIIGNAKPPPPPVVEATKLRASADAALHPRRLSQPGTYDLRMTKGGKTVGCASPVGLFAGHEKYGCGGKYRLKPDCEAAANPVQKTKYVEAVHKGCLTEQGMGTYSYAYDDGVGLKQCSPLTKYEWILCPSGAERQLNWKAEAGSESDKRFRVSNKCDFPIWIQQAGTHSALDPEIVRIEPGASYAYSIPRNGLPSTRYLPKTGCDASGNACDVQSIPPCPPKGCDIPIDTKFEASWGCRYTGSQAGRCTKTAQGNPSSYQDWWDGSAVDGWTLSFSVLVDSNGDTNNGQCGPVVCAGLNANTCPSDEYLSP